jgi:hypothetical protein
MMPAYDSSLFNLPALLDEPKDWLCLSQTGLENAYGEDEPEYSLEQITEANPDDEGSSDRRG